MPPKPYKSTLEAFKRFYVCILVTALFQQSRAFTSVLLYGELGGDRTHLPEAAVLQTAGKSIIPSNSFGIAYGNRTHPTDVKGQCSKPIN